MRPGDFPPRPRYDAGMRIARQLPVSCLFAALACVAGRDARSQQGMTAPLPASAVMARGTGDGWQSRGGVVGPWWTGSGVGPQPPAADGGFWFGLPGLGFGGSQGSTRNLGGVGSTLTTTPGAGGMVSSGRLTPFVTGVIPVVGSGHAAAMPGQGFVPSAPPATQLSAPSRAPANRAARLSSPAVVVRPSTPASRSRAQRFVDAGDRHLLADVDGPTAARAALVEYRAAARFAQDDCDILIRQAILHAALGQPDAADRAIERATHIDGRLAAPLDATAPSAAWPAGPTRATVPAVAARGEAILREVAARDDAAGAIAAPGLAVLAWLEASWKSRWSGTAMEPAARKP